uniref:Uncharacterized protein n=1 Tax=Torrey Pines virus TaxID=1654361 RepID=A0A2Z4QKV4_9REOV|nr:hypothetical protein [Torrey Pines virus]AWY11152.1 hypothetical protein [Torrey Pines virus]
MRSLMLNYTTGSAPLIVDTSLYIIIASQFIDANDFKRNKDYFKLTNQTNSHDIEDAVREDRKFALLMFKGERDMITVDPYAVDALIDAKMLLLYNSKEYPLSDYVSHFLSKRWRQTATSIIPDHMSLTYSYDDHFYKLTPKQPFPLKLNGPTHTNLVVDDGDEPQIDGSTNETIDITDRPSTTEPSELQTRTLSHSETYSNNLSMNLTYNTTSHKLTSTPLAIDKVSREPSILPPLKREVQSIDKSVDLITPVFVHRLPTTTEAAPSNPDSSTMETTHDLTPTTTRQPLSHSVSYFKDDEHEYHVFKQGLTHDLSHWYDFNWFTSLAYLVKVLTTRLNTDIICVIGNAQTFGLIANAKSLSRAGSWNHQFNIWCEPHVGLDFTFERSLSERDISDFSRITLYISDYEVFTPRFGPTFQHYFSVNSQHILKAINATERILTKAQLRFIYEPNCAIIESTLIGA